MQAHIVMAHNYPEMSSALDYRRISGSYIKASIPQEIVKPVPICPKESFSLLRAEGTYGYLWHVLAYRNPCWPPGPLSITSTCYIFKSPQNHPSPSHPLLYPKLPQAPGLHPLQLLRLLKAWLCSLFCLYS